MTVSLIYLLSTADLWMIIEFRMETWSNYLNTNIHDPAWAHATCGFTKPKRYYLIIRFMSTHQFCFGGEVFHPLLKGKSYMCSAYSSIHKRMWRWIYGTWTIIHWPLADHKSQLWLTPLWLKSNLQYVRWENLFLLCHCCHVEKHRHHAHSMSSDAQIMLCQIGTSSLSQCFRSPA